MINSDFEEGKQAAAEEIEDYVSEKRLSDGCDCLDCIQFIKEKYCNRPQLHCGDASPKKAGQGVDSLSDNDSPADTSSSGCDACILDDNPLSLALYAEEYPENAEKIGLKPKLKFDREMNG